MSKTFRVHANIWIEVKADDEQGAVERAQRFLTLKVNECEMDWDAYVYCGTIDKQTACEHIEEDD